MKVGDYVRTKDGEIGKVRVIIEDKVFMNTNQYYSTNIIKSSPNIIDLIEVGDYVNGCYVTNKQARHNEGITIIPKRIGIIKCNAYFNQGNYNDCDFKWIEEENIKTIVTKEQFKQMEYKVGE